MERMVIYQEPFNVVYFLSSVVFSLDSFACIKVRSDEDKETPPVGKKPKQDHKAGEDRPLLVSKKGRDEDEEMSLDGGTFGRQNFTRTKKTKTSKGVPAKKSRIRSLVVSPNVLSQLISTHEFSWISHSDDSTSDSQF
jgi:hypothetical protein